jgi:hypothetical protein
VIAINGRELRNSYNTGLGQKTIHLGSDWANAKWTARPSKSRRIPKLLDALELAGCNMTIYDLGFQTAIALRIIVLSVNQDWANALTQVEAQGRAYVARTGTSKLC